MTTAGPREGLTRSEAGQLLVILFRYLEANIAAFPSLLPAVDRLREAVALYGRDDTTAATEQAVGVYGFLRGAWVANPAMPMP
ncbi:MAG TPA: hypothetical protein VHV82_05550 [Sporichthyaceae bacterium]|jgi:hypothetical protein|nr:hypothetical protein [Sporichthyaceae bacterium]